MRRGALLIQLRESFQHLPQIGYVLGSSIPKLIKRFCASTIGLSCLLSSTIPWVLGILSSVQLIHNICIVKPSEGKKAYPKTNEVQENHQRMIDRVFPSSVVSLCHVHTEYTNHGEIVATFTPNEFSSRLRPLDMTKVAVLDIQYGSTLGDAMWAAMLQTLTIRPA